MWNVVLLHEKIEAHLVSCLSFLPLPLQTNQHSYKVCCGKIICDGCMDEEMRDMLTTPSDGDVSIFIISVATRGHTKGLAKMGSGSSKNDVVSKIASSYGVFFSA
jgi:hypothetical protein